MKIIFLTESGDPVTKREFPLLHNRFDEQSLFAQLLPALQKLKVSYEGPYQGDILIFEPEESTLLMNQLKLITGGIPWKEDHGGSLGGANIALEAILERLGCQILSVPTDMVFSLPISKISKWSIGIERMPAGTY